MASMKDLERLFKGVPDKLAVAIKESFNEAGELIVKDAKSICPVDTGNLKNSISKKVISQGDAIGLEIIADADYANFVEYGTSKMVAQPFIRPSMEKNRDKVTELLKKSVQRAFR